ncbi:zinc finger protein 800 [Ostrinia furnacalis]|uniref:zinc finger protein 800 n=1 Tax=Ostrinia furnacalis TaxID=93504 RepID=UPI00103EF0C1|nr:zinc finger protein 800 [Ostrinia furnacalis]
MAGNKINTKTKGKEDKNKATKSIVQNNEDNEDVDFSLLRKPILTSVTGFAQARKIFDLATEELKDLLTNECDLLYECKVCRNIFRSVANFISHKRIYCTEKFNSCLHGHFFKTTSTVKEILKIKKLEESYLEVMKNKNGTETVDPDEVDNRIPLTKDLTTIIEKMAKKKEENGCISEEQNVILQKIPNSSVAVFQSLDNNEENQDKMKAQVKEIDSLMSKDKAILQNDGKFSVLSSVPSETDNVIQISDDEDDNSDNLKCKICNQNFSTQKTLKFHMKYKHLESRLVYPCPDCLEIFSTSWSVYRHLFKVHRKSAAQIRRLRESIQTKAFRMNNPPAFYEKRKNIMKAAQKITEEERLDQENQAWMDNVEGDGDTPRCFGCGRTFERRAALAAHTHTCQPRSRALAAARRLPETKKIEIQIRKDYNKGPAAVSLPVKADAAAENKANEDTSTTSKPSKDSEDKTTDKQLPNEELEDAMDVMDDDEKSDDTDSPVKPMEVTPQISKKPTIKLPFAQQAEKSNLTAFRQKIQPDIEVNTLTCKKCDIQHNSVQELYDHMAGHYKWMRYACKLCNFKTYSFEKLPEHVKVVHKLKGDSEFYFSTVKAIDGNEALELSEVIEESDANDVSPDSRRQSRCSSDSSRLSDDSSSSSTRMEAGSRKRKMFHIKNSAKRKKESLNNDEDDDKADLSLDKDTNSLDNDTSSISKTFEENSSDMDDLDDKLSRRQSMEPTTSVASRRPVRKKTKPKNEDFEYDLSNLLKMEAQGYRDAQSSVTTKTNQAKKKPNQQENHNFYDIINRDCCGALATLSKKAVEVSKAHMKNVSFINAAPKESRPSNIFVRPMLPKSMSKGEKNSPKKELVEEAKDNSSPQKEDESNKNVEKTVSNSENENETSEEIKENPSKEQDPSKPVTVRQTIATNMNIPAVLPIKFRRQSLEFIKNPIINKNITDFKKAGMKTKILVIKPINRSKDGHPPTNTPLKFQTIKLKDPSKSSSSSNDEKSSDQVVVVKVPKVDAIARTVADSNAINTEKTKCLANNVNSVNNNVSDDKTNIESDSVKVEETLKSDTSDNLPDSEESKLVSADKELKTDTDIPENISDGS